MFPIIFDADLGFYALTPLPDAPSFFALEPVVYWGA